MPKTVSIANRKGGVGKSWITFCLATELCEMDYTVVVVDMDSQTNISKTLQPKSKSCQNNIATLLNSEIDEFLSEYLNESSYKEVF